MVESPLLLMDMFGREITVPRGFPYFVRQLTFHWKEARQCGKLPALIPLPKFLIQTGLHRRYLLKTALSRSHRTAKTRNYLVLHSLLERDRPPPEGILQPAPLSLS